MVLTIFTPTYNRTATLSRLYDSLCNQTCKDFVWIIVDDGSTDYTKEIVSKWKAERKLEIIYFYQKNQGKSAAHNKGVELTNTELFTCVDSDDYLISTAVEEILKKWELLKLKEFVGILTFCGYSDNSPITHYYKKEIREGTLKNLYYDRIIDGDTMLIYKTSVIKQYKFPVFEGEKFVPEAYLYDKIDLDGKLYIFPIVAYIVEYREDGYTKNIEKLISNNPLGYLAWIEQRLKYDTRVKHRVLNTVRYLGIAFRAKKKKIITDSIYPVYSFCLLPIGFIFYLKRYKRYEDENV